MSVIGSASDHQELSAARAALFDMLCNAPEAVQQEPARTSDLTARQWVWIEQVARDHRLLSLLHEFAVADRCDVWPERLRERCLRVRRKQSRRWLVWQSTMLAIGEAFRSAGIEHVFLKGATLGLSCYPHGGMRPMRDLDILVSIEQADVAQYLLKTLGYVPLPGTADSTSPAQYQLPALKHPKTMTTVEIHRGLAPGRLFDSEALARSLLETARDHSIAGGTVRLAEATMLYCHLLLHAGIKSQFDCGPLVLADLSFLHARHPGLAPAFAEAASQHGLGRTHALFARLLDLHTRPDGAFKTSTDKAVHVSVTTNLPPDLVDHASALLVLPSGAVRARQVARGLRQPKPAVRRALALVGNALKPTRAKIAAITRVPVTSRLVWLGYPLWLLDRGRLLFAGRIDSELAGNAAVDLDLQEWLRGRG